VQAEIAPITGPMYQLFVFFMITDPKTTVKSKKWQCIVVFCVALVEMLLRLNQVVWAPLYALFLVGPTAMLIEIWLESPVKLFSREDAKAQSLPSSK
jgi:Na+-translocating ferredoxin:NAD+ oxidoreductase RnfD subunit